MRSISVAIILLVARWSNAELTLEDIVAKEQQWAKMQLERHGHVIAGDSDYLNEILNMDHHLQEIREPVGEPVRTNLRVSSSESARSAPQSIENELADASRSRGLRAVPALPTR